MKKICFIVFLMIICPVEITFAELTKQDIAEIRNVVKEEIGYVNKRIDDLEQGLNKRIDDTNKRIDDLGQSLNKRVDDLQNIMLTGFAILFSGMFTVVAFVIWDRRTALAPAVKQIEELSQKEKAVDKVLEVLKVYARKEPRFKEAMQTAGLL
ncbi:MAG: hypothetical protein ABIF11_05525 [Nitrospirota bacterium]